MTITSPQNEKLQLVRRLAEPRGRARTGMFVSEGEDLLKAGLDAGWSPELVLVAAGSGLEGVEVEPALLGGVSTLGSGTRAIAVWRRPDGDSEIGAPCVYLAGVRDPGNLGAIVRSAAALCAGSVVLGPGCADPWGPKAVRAAMGAGFAFPPASGSLERTPRPRLALSAHGGEDLDDAVASIRPRTIVLGSEREGLDPGAIAGCDGVATIAMRVGAESLNVAAAAAIALHRVCSAAGSPGGEASDG
jgi:TrmH family RNA methyltransferase